MRLVSIDSPVTGQHSGYRDRYMHPQAPRLTITTLAGCTALVNMIFAMCVQAPLLLSGQILAACLAVQTLVLTAAGGRDMSYWWLLLIVPIPATLLMWIGWSVP